MIFEPPASSNGRMRFAREGYPFMLGAVFSSALAWVAVAVAGPWTIVLASLLTVLTAFRLLLFP